MRRRYNPDDAPTTKGSSALSRLMDRVKGKSKPGSAPTAKKDDAPKAAPATPAVRYVKRGTDWGGTIKNGAIIAGLGVVGYVVWKNIGNVNFGGVTASGTSRPSVRPTPAALPPDLKGPKVVRGELASTHSTLCITSQQQDHRMRYAPIQNTDSQGYQSFTSPVTGHFTRRLLCLPSGQKFAEIYPGA